MSSTGSASGDVFRAVRCRWWELPAYVFFCVCGVSSLGFTKAITLNIGFPLKLYEVFFVVALVLSVFGSHRLPRQVFVRYFSFIFVFWCVATFSSWIAILTPSEPGDVVQYRGGAAADALMRVVYLAFNISVLVLVFQVATRYRNVVISSWLHGMSLAATYHLYSFFSTLFIGDAILLPGLDRHQVGHVGSLVVPRSGTFEEGNFAGLYYLLSIVLSIYHKKYICLVLALSCLVLTLSTSSLAGLLVFYVGYVLSRQSGLVRKAIFVAIASVVSLWAFYFLSIDTKFAGDAGASGAIRLNEGMTGVRIFLAHPIFGAGLGQYGFLFDKFEWDSALSIFSNPEKHIPNNVYIELLAETGVVGFLIFAVFWFRWGLSFARTAYPLRLFFLSWLAIGVVCVAYPTFNITYLWCFIGLSLSISYVSLDQLASKRDSDQNGHGVVSGDALC